MKITLPKTNMEPENAGFQKEYPLLGGHFQVLCYLQDFTKLSTAGFVIQDCSYTQVDDELAADLIGAWGWRRLNNRDVVMILLRNNTHH